ncbi:MAG: TRAP transporter small permease subunit [Thermoanaerobaculia bacterium]|nr:TRAP transporter small permease subunit [Thermoanaerobaculia bacterium]
MTSFFDSGLRRGLRAAHHYDRFSRGLGNLVGWLALVMVLVGAYNAIVRYLDKFHSWTLSSNAYIEMQWYLFSIVFLFGASYTLLRDRHVRVDVLYGRLSQVWRDRIDLVGTFVLMLPFTAYALWVSVPSVRNSWAVRETSPDPGGLARYPIKAALLVSFALLALQGLSEALKIAARMRGLEGPSMATESAASGAGETS